MKRIISLILILVTLFITCVAVTGCGDYVDKTNKEETNQPQGTEKVDGEDNNDGIVNENPID